MKQVVVLLSALAMFLISTDVSAQKLDLDDVGVAYLRNSGAIVDDNAVKGYYYFYEVDKVDRKTREYVVRVLDQNLNKVSEKIFIGEKHLILREVTFNGTSLLFKFYDSKQAAYVYKRLSNDNKLVTLKTDIIQGSLAKGMAAQNAANNIDDISLFGIDKTGFAGYSFSKTGKKTGYVINYFGEDNKKWTAKSSASSKEFEMASFVGGNENVVMSLISTKSSMRDKDMDSNIVGHDTKTGKKLFEKSLVVDKYTILPVNFYVNNAGESILVGLYFSAADKELKGNSIGMAFVKLGDDGTFLATKFSSWTDDMGDFLSVDQKGRFEDAGYAFVHKVFQDDDGNSYVVTEQYKKAVSGGGMAMKILSGGGGSISAAQVIVNDLMIMKYDKEFKLVDIDVIEKHETKVALPSGGGLVNPMILGMYCKTIGGFDYEFTQVDRDANSYYIGYMDLEKNKEAEKKSDRRKWIMGGLAYIDGNELLQEKIVLENESTKMRVYPAKPGYVMISEYYKKEKRISMRLEQFNF
ncbi:MAG: hypothetical protein GY751_17475 [Bacteroidetes bacterium]|nr:hypothetical protein [Bacteroidota bacterium]